MGCLGSNEGWARKLNASLPPGDLLSRRAAFRHVRLLERPGIRRGENLSSSLHLLRSFARASAAQ